MHMHGLYLFEVHLNATEEGEAVDVDGGGARSGRESPIRFEATKDAVAPDIDRHAARGIDFNAPEDCDAVDDGGVRFEVDVSQVDIDTSEDSNGGVALSACPYAGAHGTPENG